MRFQTKTRKTKGFSTPELMVSGGVMLAVTVLTFEVMLTNTKLSADSVAATTQESQQRSGIDLIQQDILESNATVSTVTAEKKFNAKDNMTLILRQPVYDGAGKVVANQKKYVVYTRKDHDGKQCLVRLAGIQTGTSNFDLIQTDIIATDVEKLEYRLAKSISITPSVTGLLLPATATNSEPKGSQIRMLKLEWPYNNTKLDNDIESRTSRGVNTAQLAILGTQITTASLISSKTTPLPPVDVLYEVDEEYSSKADNSTDANQIKVWLTVKGRKDQPDTILRASGMMRNTQ